MVCVCVCVYFIESNARAAGRRSRSNVGGATFAEMRKVGPVGVDVFVYVYVCVLARLTYCADQHEHPRQGEGREAGSDAEDRHRATVLSPALSIGGGTGAASPCDVTY
ncbi:hypothetical protein PLESTM_000084300 [Pleodorina starrii]|nr:hypothetical protein PLESTM_000084300 [Pleodorina starrii]